VIIALTGQIFSQAMHTISHSVLIAIVSNGVIKPGGCGQTPTHAPQRKQAFQLISKNTGAAFGIGNAP
jgi:hypothetical protein